MQNIVASCDVRFKIRLEGLSLQHNQFSSYEPEMFPGLIYRMVRLSFYLNFSSVDSGKEYWDIRLPLQSKKYIVSIYF